MNSTFPHTVLRWALAAVIGIAGTAPPALVHTHAGWNNPDEHHTLRHHHHAGRHHEHHAAHHKHVEHAKEASHLSDAVPHVHLAWLGFKMTFPVPADHRPGDEGEDDFAGVYVRLIDEELSAPQHANTAGQTVAALNSAPACEAVAAAIPRRFASTPASCAPLCDTARHERSGVQLI